MESYLILIMMAKLQLEYEVSYEGLFFLEIHDGYCHKIVFTLVQEGQAAAEYKAFKDHGNEEFVPPGSV